MDYQEILQALASLNEKYNEIVNNAKSINELMAQAVLNPNSFAAVYNPTTQKTEKITIKQIIDEIINGNNLLQNQLISVGEITIDGNDVTVPSGVNWVIATIPYFTTTDYTFTIPFCSIGNTRIDLIVATTLGTLIRLNGTETDGIAVRPNIPINTVLVTQINVSDSGFDAVDFGLSPSIIAALNAAHSPGPDIPFLTLLDLPDQDNFVRVQNVDVSELSGVGTIEEQICEYILALTEEEQITISETDSKWNIALSNGKIYEIINKGKGLIEELTPENLLLIKSGASGGGGIESITGPDVDNTDAANPVVNRPNLQKATDGVGNNATTNPLIVVDETNPNNKIEIKKDGIYVYEQDGVFENPVFFGIDTFDIIKYEQDDRVFHLSPFIGIDFSTADYVSNLSESGLSVSNASLSSAYGPNKIIAQDISTLKKINFNLPTSIVGTDKNVNWRDRGGEPAFVDEIPTSLAELSEDATHRTVTDAEKLAWNAVIGGSIFQSVWNASTNTPTLTSSVGTKGHYYIVDTNGSTNLNGITDWKVGDWAIFDGSVWRKVDNTDAVSSVNGNTGAVNLDTSNVPSTLDKRYVTDANLTKINAIDQAVSSSEKSTWNGKEDASNKTSTVTGNETSTSLYLTIKGYYDYLVGLTWLTNTRFGTWINGLFAKTTLVDADFDTIMDSEDSNKAKKVSLLNRWNYFKSKADAVYAKAYDFMRLTSAYTLTNTTATQKLFNVGSSGNGSFNASANKTYEFECEIYLTDLSTTTGTVSFGFDGTAGVSTITYQAISHRANVLSTSGTATMFGSITSSQTIISISSGSTTIKAQIKGAIITSTAGTLIPSVSLSIAAAATVVAGTNFKIREVGSNTVTASSNIT